MFVFDINGLVVQQTFDLAQQEKLGLGNSDNGSEGSLNYMTFTASAGITEKVCFILVKILYFKIYFEMFFLLKEAGQ